MNRTLPDVWVTCPRPNPQARLRLFCFPYAGGGAATFRPWAFHLPDQVEVCPIELPGRGTRMREPAMTQLDALVRAIATALQPYLDKPFACFGHSMGGLISFELARLLRRNNHRNPVHLFLSGRRAPQLADAKPPLHTLSDAAFQQELRRLNGTPAAVLENPELMQLLLPILRADFKAIETYEYQSERPLECPLTVLGGLHDPEVSLEDLEAWREQTTASFALKLFPGDHFFLQSHQTLLLECLSNQLNRL